ncbi:signal peptidase II [Candidatus Marinamargulisbacteria bacterium SCGC AG-439-L15]|nr:signal peptidase II [Candidatus Marinamargulisbacteria bacterium SCGC AG-439-L15]
MYNRFLTAVLVFGVAADQLSKYFATRFLSHTYEFVVLPFLMSFQLVHNSGAAYGIFRGQQALLLFVSLSVIFFVVMCQHLFSETKLSQWGATFLCIGAIGNFIDRFFLGYVVDFINIHIIPVFNIADVCINIGVACFFLGIIHEYRSQRK